MATIKSYTDISQSKKLAEILPLESADMIWVSIGLGKPFARTRPIKGDPEEFCACWSLAALLDILPFPVLYMEMLGGMILWSCECHFMETNEVVKMEHYNNPIDACYEMIIRLNELNLL